MSTASTDALMTALRTRALTYADAAGQTLAVALESRLYRQSAPATPVYPYAVFGLRSPQLGADNQQLKESYDFEGFLYHRPRGQQATAEALADLWAASLRTYRDATSGLVYASDVIAESLPPATSPADANVVTVRVFARLHAWPQFISALSS